jgi:hypothetical protein
VPLLAAALQVAVEYGALPVPDLILAIETEIEPFRSHWLKEYDLWPEGGRSA